MSTSPNPSKSPPVPQKAHSPRSPAVPHFEDPPDPQDEPPESHQAEHAAFEGDDEIPYPEPTSEQALLPPPNFKPFFTIVEDPTTGEHYHPYVHYVFADDDPVIVTAAAMRSLGLDDTKYLPQPEGDVREHIDEDEEEQEQEPAVESPLPPPIPGYRERFLIVDIGADGHTIAGAQSMSPDWQVTNATVRTAPSFEEGAPDSGYMLKIEGIEVPGKSKGKAKGQPGENKLKEARDRSQGDVFGALDGLLKGVEGSLEVAGKIAGRQDDVRESERTVLQDEQAQEGRRSSFTG
ncbi:hypothetical protein BU26DRAFT_146308 [Trematosphaeria pertusa]|uniref:Uncharacterized protein n=1 Tax=Trematosphaeria pertusa TaxID=390896 RepID=A0A6A6IY41_9PLEO|nr:uncharacterized protein BU26DRAFT_146308 [Trematosphaeria pertusa]KAF2254842.1 hypothetical protein BU26DRAFT_146308 [Trematosphaeria pertusa]